MKGIQGVLTDTEKKITEIKQSYNSKIKKKKQKKKKNKQTNKQTNKLGTEFRSTFSSIGAPNYNLGKFLINKVNSFPKFKSLNLNNSMELVEKL